MKLMRCNPKHEHPNTLFGNWMERFFDNDFFFKDYFEKPAVNMKEDKDGLKLEFALPGWNKEEIQVSLEGNYLLVKGEKKKEKENSDMAYLRREFASGSFVRRFRLEKSVDESQIEARFRNGILEVSLPEKEKGQDKIREIEVH